MGIADVGECCMCGICWETWWKRQPKRCGSCGIRERKLFSISKAICFRADSERQQPAASFFVWRCHTDLASRADVGGATGDSGCGFDVRCGCGEASPRLIAANARSPSQMLSSIFLRTGIVFLIMGSTYFSSTHSSGQPRLNLAYGNLNTLAP